MDAKDIFLPDLDALARDYTENPKAYKERYNFLISLQNMYTDKFNEIIRDPEAIKQIRIDLFTRAQNDLIANGCIDYLPNKSMFLALYENAYINRIRAACETSIEYKQYGPPRVPIAELGRATMNEINDSAYEEIKKIDDKCRKQVIVRTKTCLYRCPACKGNDVENESVQTRGSDEPATIFCRCVTCGLRFRR